ncbi:MAG: YHS domain protein [Motiliproteus sp.]|nr:YHS domain protein [Motiliproteus sp.]MCW9051101.1 YHS domain protein [Motiliproteus sp.]
MTALRTLILSTLLLSFNLLAADENRAWYPYDSGLGADGYDLVAYFNESEAARGSETFTEQYGGKEWRFKSAENRSLFIKQPEKYLPQYGGYCAYAASQGYLAFGDPQQWSVHKGKLYFNYSQLVKARWSWQREDYIVQGDRYWPELQAKALER